MSAEAIKENIDKGIIDILIELNRKGYRTLFSCEGHVGFNVEAVRKPENYWQGYIGFAKPYKFPIYPPKYNKVSKDKMYFYWEVCKIKKIDAAAAASIFLPLYHY